VVIVMKVKEILELEEFDLITDKFELNNEVNGMFASDLLSHVMGNASIGDLLITVLNNINVLGVASLLDLSCVIFSSGIKVNDEIIIKANELEIPLIRTKLTTVAIILALDKVGLKDKTLLWPSYALNTITLCWRIDDTK